MAVFGIGDARNRIRALLAKQNEEGLSLEERIELDKLEDECARFLAEEGEVKPDENDAIGPGP